MPENVVVEHEDTLNGKPHIKNTKLSVEVLIRLLLSKSRSELCDLYDLTEEEIETVIEYAEENRPKIAQALAEQQHISKLTRQIPQTFTCDCGEKWDSIDTITEHCETTGCTIISHNDTLTIKCTCGETYTSKTTYISHVLQQQNPIEHDTDEVDYTTTTES